MDQIKIGKFIATRRKMENMTQVQLAEKLGITDRAVSKWENGRSLPDSSVMLELCAVLKITVNDLLSGEEVTMEQYNKELEKNLLDVIREKEQADRQLLSMEVVIGVVVTVMYLLLILVACFAQMADWVRMALIVLGLIPFGLGVGYAVRIEQIAGYYVCAKCGHRYVPTYKSVLMAVHSGRTRYMRCPKCNEKSWQKKMLKKE